jgi:hypothetical protein
MINCKYLIATLAAACLSASALGAEIVPIPSNPPWMRIEGEITSGDFESVFSLRFKRISTIELNSAGGDLVEAMRIGRHLRRSYVRTIVHTDSQCNSACFLIWVAGVERSAFSPIGIHRPYFDKEYFAGLSAQAAEEKYEIMTEQVRLYLSEMGVPEGVISQMMQVRSTEVTFLGQIELTERVGNYHVPYNEWIIAQCGDFTDDEWHDFNVVKSIRELKEYRERLAKSEDAYEMASLKHDIEVAETYSSHFQSLSEGYRNYLWHMGNAIQICQSNKSMESRQQYFEEIYDKIKDCEAKSHYDFRDCEKILAAEY